MARIVSDSSSNLYSLDGFDYKSVPLTIVTKEKEFKDDGNVDIDEFHEVLRKTKEKTTTSCPNTFQWLDAFEGAHEIYAITITSALSGSYNAASQAAEQYMQEHTGAKVHVFDSLSAGPELPLVIEKIAELAKEGKDFDTVVKETQDYQKHTHLLFTLESLTSLAKNGRVNPAVAKIAGLLGIHIIGKASKEGTLELIDKCRGSKKVVKLIMEDLEKNGFNGKKLRIAHNDNPIDADNIKQEILKRYPFAEIVIERTGALCSYYAEEKGIMIGYEDGRAE